MKQMKLIKLAALTLAGLAFATTAIAVPPNYLLTVDISDLSAVTFTATTNAPNFDDMSSNTGQGVNLLDFFLHEAGTGNDFVSSSSLIGAGSGESYNYFQINGQTNPGSPGSNVNLNFLVADSGTAQNFTTTSPAFTGILTIDLSSYAGDLPSVGDTGFIQPYQGSPFGSWLVISAAPTPEPGTLALAGIGGIGAFFFARRRK